MKSYKDCEKKYIGGSDIAALILVGCKEGEGLKTAQLCFGEDGDYRAYIVTEPNVLIGDHYKKVATFNHWLKIYDDDGKTFDCRGKEFNIYRAGDFGCIIQIVPLDE